MGNSSAVYVRMDPALKETAEEILAQLGITSSGAVQMLYKQIILHRGLPFSLTLPDDHPVAVGGMSRTQIDAELNNCLCPPGKNTARDQVNRIRKGIRPLSGLPERYAPVDWEPWHGISHCQ